MSQAQNICIIIAVNLIFYFKTLRYKYVSDDVPSAMRTPEKSQLIHYLWVLEGKLKSISYKKMSEGFYPINLPEVDHLITIVLHTLVCVGIYLGFGSNNISLLAAILFSFNPINNQGAVWLSGRGYVLSALGMVWALAVPWEMGWLSLLVATYSNAGFLMPVALLGSNHPQLLFFMPFIWALYYKNFSKNVKAKMKMETFYEDLQFHWGKIVVVFKTFGFYLTHALVPIKNTFYHSLLESMAGSQSKRAYTPDRYFAIGLVSFGLMLLYVITHKWDMVCFGLLWWCVGIAPFLNLRRMQQEISERYCYVPSIGIMVVLASAISLCPLVVGVFVSMYAVKMWFYMDAYKDDFWLIEYSVMNSQDSWFAWHIRGVQRWQSKSFQEAIVYWIIAKNLSPKEFKLLYNIGLSLIGNGRFQEALEWIAEAEKNIPRGQEQQAGTMISQLRTSISNIQETIKKNPGKQLQIELPILI